MQPEIQNTSSNVNPLQKRQSLIDTFIPNEEADKPSGAPAPVSETRKLIDPLIPIGEADKSVEPRIQINPDENAKPLSWLSQQAKSTDKVKCDVYFGFITASQQEPSNGEKTHIMRKYCVRK